MTIKDVMCLERISLNPCMDVEALMSYLHTVGQHRTKDGEAHGCTARAETPILMLFNGVLVGIFKIQLLLRSVSP